MRKIKREDNVLILAGKDGGDREMLDAGLHSLEWLVALQVLDTGRATANCAWGDDGSVLYITADKYLCRLKTRTKGAGW